MLTVINPATGETVRELEEDTPETVHDKFILAQKAQPAWAARALDDRRAVIERFRDLLTGRSAELARTLTTEMGKPFVQVQAELAAVPKRIDFFLEKTAKVIADETVFTAAGLEERISYEPLGVIANISAWNYPYFVGSNVFVPALLTGNAVLYKPSPLASLTGLAIGEMLHGAGVPAEIFQVLIGAGKTVGEALVAQSVDGIFFTGSYAVGKRIGTAAGPRMVRVQLELGGKDPIYVREDVDVAHAAEQVAEGAFYNTGQSCCAVERIYVHEKIADAFVEAFVKVVEGFEVGDPMSETTYIGPLARALQLDVLERQVQDAITKGAKLELGGKPIEGAGYFFEPTVITGADESMLVMRDESFGPIIGIQRVADDDEAVERMNDTNYGLTAGVFTEDRTTAEKILAQLQVGTAYWNCCDRVSPYLPWTGRRRSGIGSTLSHHGIRAFVQPKAWHLRKP